jgi:Gpi18-like mannosyltransferase
MNAPTIFAFAEAQQTAAAQHRLAWSGMLLAGLAALGVIAQTYLSRERSPRQLVLLSLLSVVAVPYFLPHMHERYFYLVDVISVLYAWYRPQAWYVPVIIVTASLFAYLPYLAEAVPVLGLFLVDLRLLSVCFMAAIGLMIVTPLAGPEEDRVERGK